MASAPRPATITTSLRETADIDSSTSEYARRFSGPVGQWFLETQTRLTLAALAGLQPGASVLDVGGGHAQTAPPLVAAGYRVTVAGSDVSCGERLRPWTTIGACRFGVADLQHLPYADRTFDAVICYRLMAHSVGWLSLIAELCRVAHHRVVLDYPSRRSVNVISDALFGMKQTIEGGTTRPYALYRRAEIAAGFAAADFRVVAEEPQFLLPMALHRLTRSAALGRALEWGGRLTRLTRALGSPVIVRADREAAD